MSITGQKIKNRRKQLNMSADDVASLLNVSRSTIFRYENGYIGKIPANILEKLAEILKTTPAYLMDWEDDYIDDGILIKEAAGDYYVTNESSDRAKIAAMAEIYLSLADSGKKKAYDYILDLSEQSKYRKEPVPHKK